MLMAVPLSREDAIQPSHGTLCFRGDGLLRLGAPFVAAHFSLLTRRVRFEAPSRSRDYLGVRAVEPDEEVHELDRPVEMTCRTHHDRDLLSTASE